MLKKYKDIVAGSVCLILSTTLFVLSFYVKKLTVSRVGSDFVPKIVFIMLIVLSIILIIKGYMDLRKQKDDKQQYEEETEKQGKATVWLTLCLIALYIALLDKVGFLIMTAVYLFVQFIILSPKKPRKYLMFALIAVLTSSIIYFLFLKVFQLMLPAGLLG